MSAVRSRFLAGLATLAAAFAGIVGLIWLATADAPPARPQPAAAPEATAAGDADRLIDLARAPLGGLPGQEYAIVKDTPAPAPPPGSWEAVPILAARRGHVSLDLEDLQPRLAGCFSPAAAARGGQVLEVKDAAPLRDEAATTLLLELEVTGDRVHVVEAPVESRGMASSGTLSCAQALLRGTTAPSPGLAQGRHRLRFTLAP